MFAWDFRNPKVGTFWVLRRDDVGLLTPKLETQKVAVKLESQDRKQNVVHAEISGLDVATFSTGIVTVYSQVL